MSIEYDNYLISQNILVAVFTDEETALYHSLISVSSKTDYITDMAVKCFIDEVNMVIFNAEDYIFVLVRKSDSEEVENLINSLL